METRRQQSEDGPPISRRSDTGSCTSRNRIENSDPIPTDLVTEILSRSPAKFIARCRCVSKSWGSTLRGRVFTDLFVTRSSARPRLLLSCLVNSELLFYSAPHIQNQDDNSFLAAAANYQTKFPFGCSEFCGLLRGLVCLTYQRIANATTKETVPVICNATTGQSLALPKVRTRRVGVRTFFGYDPVGKQFKVLAMTSTVYWKETCTEHQILTLGTSKLSWKKIDCSIPHYPVSDGICINGCLYYQALVGAAPQDHGMKKKVERNPSVHAIVCFDVRSERFRVINKAEGMVVVKERYPTFANVQGKLAALMSDGFDYVTGKSYVTGESKCLELWVLEDAEQHQWSKHVYVLPPMWKSLVAEAVLYFVGVTATDEIVLSPQYINESWLSLHLSHPFYVFYYSIVGNTIRRVEIQGMGAIRDRRVDISLDHVENVELL